MNSLTVTGLKTANYNANPNELIPCDISAGSFTVTLPNAPDDMTIVQVKLVTPGAFRILTLSTSGTDKFNTATGNTSIYMSIVGEVDYLQYQKSTGIWYVFASAATYAFATNFPGIDATTPISNADVSINYASKELTVTPPLGYFNIFVDGGGAVTRYRKGTVTFPAFTDTSGPWYFYFDASGNPITTQNPWSTADFTSVAPVWRLVWNATLTPGVAQAAAEYIEYHLNTIPAAGHQHDHLGGAIWRSGFTLIHNAITAGDPNASGINTVVGMTTGSNVDDNLDYTVTNSMTASPWNQDMGSTTAASLASTTGAKFSVFVQDAGGLLSFLPATRFPFSYSAGNVAEYITTTGTRTAVPDGNFLTVFIYATQNPRTGEAIKIVTAPIPASSLTNAQANTWTTIQNAYPTFFGGDYEIRPLYRLIYQIDSTGGGAYDVRTKRAALRQVVDFRAAQPVAVAAAAGSIPASSVTFLPSDGFSATNVQSALIEGIGLGFSTTSADYWYSLKPLITAFSTTSADYYMNSSTTVPTMYKSNTYTALQTWAYASSTAYSSFVTASTTNLIVSGTLKIQGNKVSARWKNAINVTSPTTTDNVLYIGNCLEDGVSVTIDKVRVVMASSTAASQMSWNISWAADLSSSTPSSLFSAVQYSSTTVTQSYPMNFTPNQNTTIPAGYCWYWNPSAASTTQIQNAIIQLFGYEN
jgi:hypothetical protein